MKSNGRSNTATGTSMRAGKNAVSRFCCLVFLGLGNGLGLHSSVAREGRRRHLGNRNRCKRRDCSRARPSRSLPPIPVLSRRRQSNAEGFYAFVDLQPGHYDIQVTQSGFNTFRQTGILLDVDSAKVVNIKLTVGQVSEKVEISADAVQMDTASTQLGEVISGETMTSVPLVTRSYTDLLALQPGVTPTSSGLAGGRVASSALPDSPSPTFLAISTPEISRSTDSASRRTDFLLNGTTVQEFAFSGTGIIPNLDSIAEFRIVTNNFDAEYGNYAGGQINVITKSGTNKFHGSAFEFLRNRSFDATNYFSQVKDDHKQNEFGGTIGGPIVKDKLFFFADYQGNRVIQGQSGGTGFIPVPTAAERSGDFSAVASSSDRRGAGSGVGSTTFNHARIHGDAGRALLHRRLRRHCNLRISGRADSERPLSPCLRRICCSLFLPQMLEMDEFSNQAAPIRLGDNKTSGRVDYNSHLGLLSGYYFFDQYRQSVPNIFLPGFGSDFTGRSQVADIGDTKTISTTSVNELRVGLTRLRFLIHKPTGGDNVTPKSLGFEEGPDTLGISPSLPQYAHVPNIHLNNFSFGASGGPLGVTETTAQVMDNFTRIIRTHTFTFGGQFRYNQLTEYNGGSNGDFTFNGAETGVDFADFLIGAPTNYSQGQGYPSYGRSRYIGLFAPGQLARQVEPDVELRAAVGRQPSVVREEWSARNAGSRPAVHTISRLANGMGLPWRSRHSQHAGSDALQQFRPSHRTCVFAIFRQRAHQDSDGRTRQDQHPRRLGKVLQHI